MPRTKLIPFASLLLGACASDHVPDEGLKRPFPAAKTAPVRIEESLRPGPAGSGFTGVRGETLLIEKASLGKAFLLTSTISSSGQAPMPNMLLPKVVSFQRNGGELALLEQNIYSIHSEVSHGRLLQSFRVLAEDEKTLTFEWRYGLASVPVKRFSVASDAGLEGAEQIVSESEVAYPVHASFLQKAELRNNRLELRQLARIRSSESNPSQSDPKKMETRNLEETLQIDFALTPYKANPRFAARLSTRNRGVGFFEVASTRKESGAIDLLATRWDLSPEAGPITYAISKNAPPETLEAIRQGVLYWNEVAKAALGREIVKVETGADPLEAPQPRRVLIYWVPHENAGSAYANFLPDPLTGEISSGLVYQTSVFYLSGMKRGRRLLNRGVEGKNLVASGFRNAAACELEQPENFFREADLPPELPERIARKMGLDYLRHVVAHEVGHTLGLRHNFAGSIGSELEKPEDYREKFKEYLNDEHHGGARVSSSVMDYVPFRDCLLSGANISAARPLAYDKAAILWGYGDKALSAEEIAEPPYFCPDAVMRGKKLFGCANGDFGPKPLLGYAWEIARARQMTADILIDAMIDGIRPQHPHDRLSVREALVKSHPDSISHQLVEPAVNFQASGLPGTRSLEVDRKNRGFNWTNSEEYGAENRLAMGAAFAALGPEGGLPGFLRLSYDTEGDARPGWLSAQLEERLQRPDFGRGKNLGGAPYEVSGPELEALKAALRKLAPALETALLRDLLLALTGLPPKEISGGEGKGSAAAYMSYPEKLRVYDRSLGQESWQPGLTALAERLALDSEGTVDGSVNGVEVKVPRPRYPAELRAVAMRLYSGKVFSRPAGAWMQGSAARLAGEISARLAPVLRVPEGNPDKAEPAGQASKELLDWARQELLVLKALKAARE